MKIIAALVVLGVIACASAGILSPYVGYAGYYSSPVVSRVVSTPVVSRVVAAPVVSRVVSAPVVSRYVSSYASPYVSSYASPYVSSYASPYVSSYVSRYASPVAYSSGYYSPLAAYSYLLKK